MYNITIKYPLGSYVKGEEADSSQKIYEVVQVSINLIFNPETMKDAVIVSYIVIDPNSPWGEPHIFKDSEISQASNIEVDSYIIDSQESYSDMYGEIPDDEDFVDLPYSSELDEFFSNKMKSNPDIGSPHPGALSPGNPNISNKKPVPKRTIDDILDETLSVKSLSKIMGDEDGKFEEELSRLSEEFNKVSQKAT